jgi:peptide/nickel transport system ATP-binding protein
VLRLTEPTDGIVHFNGADITGLGLGGMRSLRRDMQIIFQDPYSSLNPRLPVGTAITEPMKVHNLHGNDRARKEKAMELLVKVNLDVSYYQRYPHELSGGQRQRICIARALAVEPGFIICDESVSALDVSIQAQILNLLNDLKEEFNMTYIFISHDLAVVKFMADRMMVMKAGKIEEMGPADEIYRNPASEYTMSLIEAIPKG